MTDATDNQNGNDILRDAHSHQQAGRLDAAESLYRRILEDAPNQADALRLLGALRRERGDLPESGALLSRAVESAPEVESAWLELTQTMHDLSDWEACVKAATETLIRGQNCVEAELMQAISLLALHRHEAATEAIEHVVERLPDNGGVHTFHARCLMARKMFEQAHAAAKRAVALTPDDAGACYVLGACLKRIGRNEEAEAQLQRCLAIDPRHHEALNDLADVYIARGDTQRALERLRASHASAPFNLDAISTLCFYTAFDPHSDAAALFELNRDWSRRLVSDAQNETLPAPAVARPDDKIRVAYLAYDLFDHVTSWFLEPVLTHHDRGRFHLTGYYGNEKTDAVTARLGGYVDSWQNVADDTVAETAARVRRDRIDILVLASFFRGKDRRVLAHRAAPLQVGYHNRVASTGLDTVDYIITDASSDPIGEVEEFYTEALIRLTSPNSYLPPSDAPALSPPPCLENGYVTFGSFNNHAKINDDVIDVWSKILVSIPNSRLILRSSTHFENPVTQAFFRERFIAQGVDAARLDFQGMRTTRSDHLTGMGEADIALDPFPCNGGTTSRESLWMGLPLITLNTNTFMGRQGLSYLTKLGMTDLIAHNSEQ